MQNPRTRRSIHWMMGDIGNYLKENYHAIKFNPDRVSVVEAFGETFKLDESLKK